MDRSVIEGARVEYRVLGSLEVRVDGLVIDIGGFRQRRLLAVLLSRHGSVVDTDALVEYVWDDSDRPGNAVEAARTYISRLRRSFSDAGLEARSMLVTQAPGYRLSLDDAEIDIDRYERLILEARSQLDDGETVSAVVALDDASDLWRGTPYQEFGDRPWIEGDVARLVELRRVAIEQRAAARLDLGAHAEVVGDLEQLVADEPLRTRPVELLVLALYRSGRQADALRVAARYRRALADVGLDPPASFTDLESRVAASDDELQPVIASTDTIRGYRLAEKIGEGSFSIVYRSVQPSLGREVAVKQIRAELADRPDFIRRFEAEAQMVASLEHPHIVPLYDYWREPGSAYLVMRWLRSGTLETRLSRQRLDADESARLATQIGSALAAAHRAGVEHRDVRAANVFVDDLGNNYLGDFGIAVDTSEQRGNGGTNDIRGLATVLFQAVTGKQPSAATGNGAAHSLSVLRPDLPVAVERVVLRAMVGSGDERYATVDDFVDDYVTAIKGIAGLTKKPSGIPLADRVTNPYKGLRAFQESDADDFRGRGRLVDRLLHRLAESGVDGRLVAAVGPSGSGKSSLVRAGLLPRLRAGAITGSDSWFITTMLPGQHPFEELEGALNRMAATPATGLAEAMRASPTGIMRAVNSALPDETSELLLVIDQFEELFTQTGDDATRQCFLDGLVAAVTDDRSRLRVVITIRADHWHQPLQHPDLAHILATAAVTVVPMAADELERAITDPARQMGVTFEAGLVSDIIAEVHDQSGALPLMQYLLTELFDAREAGLIEIETYRRLGGVAGGLERRADDLYEGASATEQDGIRRLFSRLITPGEGAADTRRRVRLRELTMVTEAVIDRFDSAQMLSFDHDPDTREPTVEVAHEALIREWPRLRTWVDDDRDGLRTMRHLTTSSREWDASGRPDSELYRGGRLEVAEEWATTRRDDLSSVETEFVDASVGRRTRQAADEHNRLRRLRGLLAAAATIAVIALVAGVLAWSQQRRADANASDAERERRAAEALVVLEADARTTAETARIEAETAGEEADRARDEALTAADLERDARDHAEVQERILQSAIARDDQPTLSLLLAREVHDRSPGPDTLGAILTALIRTDGYLGSLPSTIAWNNDQWLGMIDDETVVVRTPASIDVYDLRTRALTSTPSPAPRFRFGAQASTASGRFATVDASGKVLVIDNGDATPSEFAVGRDDLAASATVGRDGSTLIGYQNGDVDVFPPSGAGDPIALRGHRFPVTYAAISDDSSLAATSDVLGNITLWDLPTAEPRWTWTSGARDRWRPEAGPGGQGDAAFGLIDGGPPSDQTDERAAGFQPDAALEFSLDGETLYSAAIGVAALAVETGRGRWTNAGANFSFQLEVLESGQILSGNLLIEPEGGVTSRILESINPAGPTTLTSDGSTLIALDGERIGIWSLSGDQLLAKGFDRAGANAATLSQSGEQLAVFSYHRLEGASQGTVLDTASGTSTAIEQGGGHWIYFDGADHLVSFRSSQPRNFTIRDPKSLEPLAPEVAARTWGTIESSPDGKLFAVGEHDGSEINIYDAATGALVITLQDPLPDNNNAVFWIDFSSDGRLLAASNFEAAAIWETEQWTTVGIVEAPERESFTAVAFSPDGDELAVRSGDGRVFLHDIEVGLTTTVATGTVTGGAIYSTNSFEFSSDGRYIMVAGVEGVSVVDVEARQIVGTQIPSEPLEFGAAIANGARAAVTATADHLLVWNLAPEEWPTIACQAAGRNMTLDEWEQFGWPGEPYHATCAEWPSPV